MAEGLTLVSSTNACGFKGVSYLGLTKDNRTRRSKPYQVNINDRYVGNFATAAEGALCYARGRPPPPPPPTPPPRTTSALEPCCV